jgi:AcrR family transcriptional regulator
LERFVRASLQILEEKGPGGLTVGAIVARAGSSVGSFYARFDSKEELIAYLAERVWREAAERWDAALGSPGEAGLSLAEVVEGSVRLLGDAVEARETSLRALKGSPGAGDEAYGAFQDHVLEGVEGLLLACREEMAHPDPELAVPLGLRAVMAVLEAEDAGGDQSGDPIPRERRMGEAASLLLGYLAGEPRSGTAPGQVDFFDIWG